jgi:hypothetical protein
MKLADDNICMTEVSYTAFHHNLSNGIEES